MNKTLFHDACWLAGLSSNLPETVIHKICFNDMHFTNIFLNNGVIILEINYLVVVMGYYYMCISLFIYTAVIFVSLSCC